ncbi:unnamed protein product [Caenorhabditis angaria]|uniref:Uncharacterized protein n=1 Tax=Caenorhabditis angaria TaxID=860376 RepID=A0A9P1I3Y8_9PELO|nr:unnamed protein product [Caenorhabditis angaria]
MRWPNSKLCRLLGHGHIGFFLVFFANWRKNNKKNNNFGQKVVFFKKQINIECVYIDKIGFCKRTIKEKCKSGYTPKTPSQLS